MREEGSQDLAGVLLSLFLAHTHSNTKATVGTKSTFSVIFMLLVSKTTA